MIRDKAEKVLGKLQASFYYSSITLFVESGAFFTIWSVVYLVALQRDSWVQDIFLLPFTYILVSYCIPLYTNSPNETLLIIDLQAITRMFIIIRMARDRAWSKDIIAATRDGELDWQISSAISMPPQNVFDPPPSPNQIYHEIS
jgi:hypothetical protein